MIRDYKKNDRTEVNELFKKIDNDYEVAEIKEIEGSDKFIVWEENDEISGAAFASFSINGAKEKQADVSIFVEPSSRYRGIGTSLFNAISNFARQADQDIISGYIPVDKKDPSGFCNKMGLDKWWGSLGLVYKGSRFSESHTHFQPYEEKYFKQFVKIVQDCYYPIQKSNDLKPYLASPESVREYQLKDVKNVYLAMDGEKIMASVTIGEGEVDNLMVTPRYQGRGLGRQALHFAMNKMLDEGYEEIHISYMDNNKAAEKLYFSAGFKLYQNTQVYRKYIK